ncbi:large conductance mechanosensitive channel protein MscL [Virgibacillus necropolis]|uniref:Large-conductance mechanosensitive channel n=1 Tax=Virgibacillus necropolis TaxID=163877 RepID=A0A221MGM3_9BACI|nr:large conductance mechanosensitive channel protein MscL [Virgibacillus necropolis]ASN06784.1 large-conductance mechanosensitive channel [Virgibacillus necropolis]
MWKEFKAFAVKGNVLDLAIAVVVGGAFGNIVSSLVDNIITPLIGILLDGINFSNLMYKIGSAEVTYGIFIQSVFDFVIISFTIFISIRFLMKIQPKEDPVEDKPPKVDSKEELLIEIRDLLKNKKIK